jgi:lysophospholipase L1-like esterase
MSLQGPWHGESEIPETFSPSFVALGDSWFWYPNNNLTYPIQRYLNGNVAQPMLVLGASGADAEEYTRDTYARQLDRVLDRDSGYGRTVRAVFLSGGGNDVAGTDDFPLLLRADCSGLATAEDCFRAGEPRRMARTITAYLMTVHDQVQRLIPGTPVLVHTYDYAIPNGVGFLGLGQWLQDPMDSVGVARSLQQRVVDLLIDALAQAQLDAMTPTFLSVESRGTLLPDDWANELHPTAAGFNKIARRWRDPLRQLGLRY